MSGTGAEERLAVRLAEAGVPEGEVAAAAEAGGLAVLAIDRLLLPGVARYTRVEVAERADVPLALAIRLWRALGFADLTDDDVAFTDTDLEMLGVARSYLDHGLLDEELLVQLTRVVGGSMSRIAEAQMGAIQERMEAAGLTGPEAVEFALALVGVFQRNWERLFATATSASSRRWPSGPRSWPRRAAPGCRWRSGSPISSASRCSRNSSRSTSSPTSSTSSSRSRTTRSPSTAGASSR